MSKTQILSAVWVPHKIAVGAFEAELRAIHTLLSQTDQPFECVVVLNALGDSIREKSESLSKTLQNLQIYELAFAVSESQAVVCGLSQAIGDLVSVVDTASVDPAPVSEAINAVASAKYEVAIVESTRGRVGALEALARRVFHWLFFTLHRVRLAPQAPRFRIYSRVVVNAILHHDAPNVAMDVLPALHRYSTLKLVDQNHTHVNSTALLGRVRDRWKLLVGLNAMPLRLANIVCVFGAASSLLYSLYVVAIFILKSDVMPGWTTLSLVMSGMLFLISIVLSLLSEYMIFVLDQSARRGGYEIRSEVTSPSQAKMNQLNVERVK